jgi:hypothetical protein
VIEGQLDVLLRLIGHDEQAHREGNRGAHRHIPCIDHHVSGIQRRKQQGR